MAILSINSKNLIVLFFALFLSSFASFFLEKNSLHILAQFETSTTWQSALDYLSSLTLLSASVILLIFSLIFDIKVIFRCFFMLSLLLLISFFYEPLQNEHEILHYLSYHKDKSILTLFEYAPLIGFRFTFSKVIAVGLPFFFFAFTNRFFSFQTAGFLYPLLIIFNLITNYLFFQFTPHKDIFTGDSVVFGFLLIGVMTLCFLCYEFLFFKLKPEEKNSIKPTSISKIALPFLCLSFATSYTFFFDQIGNLSSFKVIQTLFQTVPDNMPLKTVIILLQTAGLLFLLSALFFRKQQAWKNFYSGSLAFVIIIGILFFYYNLSFNGDMAYTLIFSEKEEQLCRITIGLGYQILVLGVTAPSFFCLKELALQILPPNLRLTGKIIVDLIYYKGGLALALLVIDGSLNLSSTIGHFFILATFFVLGALFLSLFSAYRLGKSIETQINFSHK